MQKYDLELSQIPYLIHGDIVISGVFPIIKYCCLRFNRPDLLGASVPDGIKIAEILVKYTLEKNRFINSTMQAVQNVLKNQLG